MNETGGLYEELFTAPREESLCRISISLHAGAVILTTAPAGARLT